MALNECKESENNSTTSPAACLLITNKQGNNDVDQIPRKLVTDTDEPEGIFQNSSESTDCEPRMLDINGPEIQQQDDSGIELESQIIQTENVDGNVNGMATCDSVVENNHVNGEHSDSVFKEHMNSNEKHFCTSEMENGKQNGKMDGEKRDPVPQRRKSCPEPSGMRLSLSLPISADDMTEESTSSSALSIEEITKMARKMSRPTLHKEGHVRDEDLHVEHSPPHFAKQTTREFQNRYRPVSENLRYVSSDRLSSALSPRNRGMAHAFSQDENTRFVKKKSPSVYNQIQQNVESDNVLNITAIESQVINANEMTDEQRALNDITAMTRKATRPTVGSLELPSSGKARSKSVTQIKSSPLSPALSPVRSPMNERSPGQVFHYPEHHDVKTRSKSLAHVSLSTNPALSPGRSSLSRSSSTSSSSDYSPMNNVPDPCYRCWKTVYPLDKVGPIRKVLFHKICFKCFECGTSLSLQNYCQNPDDKMDKAVYCKSHQPIVESSHVTLEDRNLNITMNYPKVSSGYNSNIRVPEEDRRHSANIRPLSIRGAVTVPKLDIVCGDSLNDSFSSRTHPLSNRGTPRSLDTNGNEFDEPIVETRSRQTAMINSPRHLSLADDIKLTPVWSRSALNAAHLDIASVNRNNSRNFYSYGSDAWNNL